MEAESFPEGSEHEDESKEQKDELFALERRTKLIIRTFASILAAAFSYLKLRGLPISGITSTVSAESLLKISLAIYYISWVFGAPSDATDQVKAYYTGAPKVRTWSYSMVLILFGLFAVLFYAKTFRVFSIFLLIFWLVHGIFYIYYIKAIVNKPLEASKKYFEKNHLYTKLEKVNIVENHNKGEWGLWRWLCAISFAIVIVILSFTNLAEMIASLNENLTPDFIRALVVLLFVISIEGWVWIMRIKMKVSFRLLDSMEEKYSFSRKN